VGRSFLRRLFSQQLRDIQPGDAVRVVGYSGVAWVREISGDTAVVVWGKDRRAILMLVQLRRVKAVGHQLDRRGE
jgi:hypothetical protein